MAGGFTVMPDRVEAFRHYFVEQVSKQRVVASGPVIPETAIDGLMSLRGLRPEVVRILQDGLGPFGIEHAEPVFVIPYARIYQPDIVGQSHIRCWITDMSGNERVKGIAFKSHPSAMGRALLDNSGSQLFHLLGQGLVLGILGICACIGKYARSRT